MDEKKNEPRSQEECLALLRQIQADAAARTRYARQQSRMASVCAGCCAGVLAVVLALAVLFVPRLNQTMEQVDGILQDMASVSSELNRSLPELLTGLDSLTGASAQALEKIAALDIEAMNEAIADLRAVVEPLANLFGR